MLTAVSAAFNGGAITAAATVGQTLQVAGTFTASAGVTISGELAPCQIHLLNC